jgi:hypothetical protein
VYLNSSSQALIVIGETGTTVRRSTVQYCTNMYEGGEEEATSERNANRILEKTSTLNL